MQDLSYDPRDPTFTYGGLTFAVQVFTPEHLYGLDPQRCETRGGETFELHCDGLTWAGGQERAPGSVRLRAGRHGDRVRFDLEATAPHAIRGIKLVVKGQRPRRLVHLREGPRSIPPTGLVLRYPDGWRGLYTPLVVVEDSSGALLCARSLDPEVREKRFALVPRPLEGEGLFDLELIFDELATRSSRTLRVPTWEVGPTSSVEASLTEHARFLETAHELQRWETRPDVPAWARDISLVAAIHGQHYSGYVFNDYARMLDTLRWLAERLEGRRILAYLPGWEGRYYWQYGDYRPDERMGGAEGFARLCDGARALGVHLMPMFGLNVVNCGLPNFEAWGETSRHTTAGGNMNGGSVDWDGTRHYDHGWGALLNPGAPRWQGRLVEQVTGLADRYGFDGAFLDISAAWVNDPRWDTLPGLRRLVERLREGRPDLLVAGEGWYDAHSLAVPLTQSGHTDGLLHHHDEPYGGLFDPYARSFGHLCLGDPGRGSSGVHELGLNPIRRTPVRRGVIPTVTIVEDTLAAAPGEVKAILGDAREYARRFLRAPVLTP
ncbi:hypothetical protein DAETH_36050 (plasmid) [Deinococcus aetherius]|uniref:Uncharacterized protein n=1 Tax=Deinococcus aetherius TaxID=200252 RepID=A0ABM8AIJ4_9DEIO|nr:hypothetical protein [Deinococcus aetherius]BDP43636.1 hypothetical protein DAETH_36050 [Deinococcus aetherius]